MSKQFFAFVKKEFYHILRDKRTMLILLGMPVVQILIFGFAINMEVQNIRIAIFEPQVDVYTQDIRARVEANPYFIPQPTPHSIGEVNEMLRKGEIDIALVFPREFHNNLVEGGRAQIQIIADSSDPNIGTISTNYLRAIIAEQQMEWMGLQEIPYHIDVTSKLHYNPEMKSAYTFVPGIMGLVLMIICAIMTSISIVREKDMENDRCDIILVIPPSFDEHLVKEQRADISIVANAVNTTQGLLGSNYLTEIITDFAADLRYEIKPILKVQQVQGLEIVPRYRYNETLDYKTFMLPAFIVLMITLICGILPSLNVVLEKELGTIHQINTTPVTKFNFILAKVIPYWIIGIIILTISIFMVWIVYGLFPSGGIVALYLASIIFILGVTALGIVVSNYSDTLQQSMFVVMFFILIIILLSGMFTPVSSMPGWAQAIAYVNPLTHFIEIMRLIYLKANRLIDLLPQMGILVAFAVVFNGWAVVSYRKSN